MLAGFHKPCPSPVNRHYSLLRLGHTARGPQPSAQFLSEDLDGDCLAMAVAGATEIQQQQRCPFLRMQ